jgi:serine/threonine protein kinase
MLLCKALLKLGGRTARGLEAGDPTVVSALTGWLPQVLPIMPLTQPEHLIWSELSAALAQNKLTSSGKNAIAMQLCQFLVTIHHHGIIHNDLGGPNMMVTYNTNDPHEEPRLVIIDWGLGWVDNRDDADYRPIPRANLRQFRWGGPTNPRCDYIWGLNEKEAMKRCAQGVHDNLWFDDIQVIRNALKWDSHVPRYIQAMRYDTHKFNS